MPYRSYRIRARRTESRVPRDEGSARFVDLQYPTDQGVISGSDHGVTPKPMWQPSPDDIFNIRDAYKWGERFWNMLKFGTQAGADAMIPMFQDAYASFVEGYQAVEEAFKLYKEGREAYDYYRAKLKRFREQFPDSPAPHEDPTILPDKPTDNIVPDAPSAQVPDIDYVQPERFEYGERRARRRQHYIPFVPVGGMQTYPGKRPPGYIPGRSRGSGGGPKISFISSRYVFD